MNDLVPLAERLKKVEDRNDELHGTEPRLRPEGLDGRVLEKVIAALEARLNEHIGQVERRVAEIDAKVALDLHAAENEILSQNSSFEKAIHQIQADLRSYVEAVQQHSTEQVAGVDRKVAALQETLPAKFREIVEAVRQAMEARLALEMRELEMRAQARSVAPGKLGELETNLHGEVRDLAAKLAADMEALTNQQRGHTEPLQQGLQELDAKLTTLREELPARIRQIVEAVEASLNARMTAGDNQAAERLRHLEAVVAALPKADAAALEQKIADLQQSMPAMEAKLATLRDELPPKIRQIVEAVEGSISTKLAANDAALAAQLQQHAEKVNAVDQKLTVLQAELPPKFKAIVDAMRQSMDTKMAADLQAFQDQHRANLDQIQRETANELRQALESRLAAGIEAMESGYAAQASNLEHKFGALGVELPAKFQAIVDAMRESFEARMGAELQAFEQQYRAQAEQAVATGELRKELDGALHYISVLESRLQSLEHSMHANLGEAVDRAAERVWRSLEARLQQRAAQAPPATAPPPEMITELRQKSTSAEQSVQDLIAGIGHLFDKRSAPAKTPEMAPGPEKAGPAPQAAPPPIAAEPAPVIEPPAEDPLAQTTVAEEITEPGSAASEEAPSEEKPPVILFKPKDSGRKWRIPFVSSFFLMAIVLAWLQFTSG